MKEEVEFKQVGETAKVKQHESNIMAPDLQLHHLLIKMTMLPNTSGELPPYMLFNTGPQPKLPNMPTYTWAAQQPQLNK